MDGDIMSYNGSPGAYELSVQVLAFMCKVINLPLWCDPFLLALILTVGIRINYDCCSQTGSFGDFKC